MTPGIRRRFSFASAGCHTRDPGAIRCHEPDIVRYSDFFSILLGGVEVTNSLPSPRLRLPRCEPGTDGRRPSMVEITKLRSPWFDRRASVQLERDRPVRHRECFFKLPSVVARSSRERL